MSKYRIQLKKGAIPTVGKVWWGWETVAAHRLMTELTRGNTEPVETQSPGSTDAKPLTKENK